MSQLRRQTNDRPPPSVTSPGEDLVTALLSLWMMVGLFADGWAHRHVDGLESFWTPSHGLFYSGFAATAGWVLWVVAVRRRRREPVPPGYPLTLVGVAVFAAGGVGDAVWHTLFGVETSVDALFSPTHLLLFAGIALVVTTPLRAFRHRSTTDRPPFGAFIPVVVSVTLLVVGAQFTFMWAAGLNIGAPAFPFLPGSVGQFRVGAGVLAILLTTAIVFGPGLWMASRWRPPAGAFTVVLGTLGVLMQLLEGFADLWEVVPPLAGGVVADVLVAVLEPTVSRPRRFHLFAFVAPVALWSIYFAVFEMVDTVRWPPEMWAGTIGWSGVVGLGMSMLVVAGHDLPR